MTKEARPAKAEISLFDIADMQEAAENAGMPEAIIDDWFGSVRSGESSWGEFEVAVREYKKHPGQLK